MAPTCAIDEEITVEHVYSPIPFLRFASTIVV